MTLVTARRQRNPDPVLMQIAEITGNGKGKDTPLEEGMIQASSWSPEHRYSIKDSFWFDNLWVFADDEDPYFSTFGVCDSPHQFKETALYERVRADPRPMCVFFVHVAKDPLNAGEGGGWRWHKWGQYIGLGKPEHEYLDDETEFDDGVYTYHAYLLA